MSVNAALMTNISLDKYQRTHYLQISRLYQPLSHFQYVLRVHTRCGHRKDNSAIYDSKVSTLHGSRVARTELAKTTSCRVVVLRRPLGH